MINLNTIDVNEVVLKLSNALFNVLDGEKDHDIENMTGRQGKELEEIIEARKIAKEIAFEKKFIPLDFNPKDAVQWLDNSGGEWHTNTGEEPIVEARNVDFMFCNDREIHSNFPAKYLDWTLDGGESDIQFWRYSK